MERSSQPLAAVTTARRSLGTQSCQLLLQGQPGLTFAVQAAAGPTYASLAVARGQRVPRPHPLDEAELAAHAAMIAQLKSPLWLEAAEAA